MNWHMANQVSIRYYPPITNREKVLNWVIQTLRDKLSDDLPVYFLTVNIIDRYLGVRRETQNFKLVAAAALYLADQYEGVYNCEFEYPTMEIIRGQEFSEAEFVLTYRDILVTLDYRLTKSTMFHFLNAFTSHLTEVERSVIMYQAVLSTFDHEFSLRHKPMDQALCVIRHATSHKPIATWTFGNSGLSNATKFFMRKKHNCVGRRKVNSQLGAIS